MPESEYTDTPTKIRVFDQDDGWAIDGADDDGRYTEAVWDHYDGVRLTRSAATLRAPEFAAEHGWRNLPIVVLGSSGPRRRAERLARFAADSAYLMEPRSDGVEMTVSVLRATAYRPPVLIVKDEHVNAANSACVTPEVARALVRALLPLCPEPGPGDEETPYHLAIRDAHLVGAALRVLAPVMSVDVEPNDDVPVDDFEFGNEPF